MPVLPVPMSCQPLSNMTSPMSFTPSSNLAKADPKHERHCNQCGAGHGGNHLSDSRVSVVFESVSVEEGVEKKPGIVPQTVRHRIKVIPR